jgi:hypothetical protein
MKTETNAAPAASLTSLTGESITVSALTCIGYAPTVKAKIVTLVKTVKTALNAGGKVADQLVELYAEKPWIVSSHKSPLAWSIALLTEATGEKPNATVYGWMQTAIAKAALKNRGIDTDLFTADALRAIGGKTFGQEDSRMADGAEEMLDHCEKNAAGKIDAKSAANYIRGGEAMVSNDEMIEKVWSLIKKYAKTEDAQRDLIISIEEKIDGAWSRPKVKG